MYCDKCGSYISYGRKNCEKCGNNVGSFYKASFLLLIGSVVYGILFFLGSRYDFSTIYASIVLVLFNLIFCIYINIKHLDSSFKKFLFFIIPIIIAIIIPGIVYFVSLFLFPSPECSGECLSMISYGLGFIAAPFFSIVCYIPIILFEVIIIVLKKQKYTIYIFILLILIISFLCVNMSIGNFVKTNSLEDTLDFEVVSISYDYEKNIPVFEKNNEKIKYYAKYENDYNDVVYYFLLKPGMYKIEHSQSSLNSDFELYKNRFYKYNNLLEKEISEVRIDETKNDNYLFSYKIDRTGDYILYGDCIKCTDENTIKRFNLNEEYLLFAFKHELEDGFKITKLY